jgi:AICAR transformylase/IMP cyclohydrolase PurH
MHRVRQALISVSDKTGLDTFIPALLRAAPGIRLYSTGGTYTALRTLLGAQTSGTLMQVSDYTGQPEMQGGLVKTLDWKIYLGLLSETYNADHQGGCGGVSFNQCQAYGRRSNARSQRLTERNFGKFSGRSRQISDPSMKRLMSLRSDRPMPSTHR